MRVPSDATGLPREPDPISRVVLEFEQAWRGGRPSLDRFRARLDSGAASFGLAELVKADIQNRYRNGDRPSAREYLDRFPELGEPGGPALSLIYEEFCLRAEAGDDPDASEFCRRYPTWRDSLASQLEYHRVLSRAVDPPAEPEFPEPGSSFGTYQLIRILGKGSAATVYLARDPALGGRLVVLKVSADRGIEPAIMGKLDHPNIVPVHASVIDASTSLRGLCMPYRAGPSLNQVTSGLHRAGIPRSARTIRRMAGGLKGEDEKNPPGWVNFPTAGSFADGVAWFGMKIALALHHAHAKGFYHRDVKPDNILMTAREGPQLLDFNLAHAPDPAGEARAAQRGGTLPYMAPEQLRAFLDPAQWEGVRGPADIYSLGLILRELLTGTPPFRPPGEIDLPRAIDLTLGRRRVPMGSIRKVNASVPHALQAIVAKCLAFDPAERYATAADLAEDLALHLERRDLIHATNPSVVERARYRIRRRRAAIATAIVLFGSVVALLSYALRPQGVLALTPTKSTIDTVRLAGEYEAAGRTDAFSKLRAETDKLPDAVVSFLRVIPEFPKSVSLRRALAEACLEKRLLGHADGAFRQIIAIDGRHEAGYLGMAKVEEARGRLAEALVWTTRAVALMVVDSRQRPFARAKVRLHRAQLLIKLGDKAFDEKQHVASDSFFDSALDDVRSLDPRPPGAALNRSVAFSREFWAAIVEYSKGKNATAQGRPAAALFASALEHLERAKEIEPDRKAEFELLDQPLREQIKKARD